MDHLRRRTVALVLGCAITAGCWGDEVASRDQVGALRTDGGEVTVLFGACADERVERVELNLTDDDFDEITRVLWSIEADNSGSTLGRFPVGDLPSGFSEVVALDEGLEADDHVQVVVTSTERGAIPMSFAVDDLRSDEVLVRQDRYRSRTEFDDEAQEACTGT